MSKPTDIERVKAVLYLKLDENLSNRDIARRLNVGAATISDILGKFRTLDCGWPLPEHASDQWLHQSLYPDRKAGRIKPDYGLMDIELRRKGVTKLLLWEEYQANYPDACYSYSQFCDNYREWKSQQKRSMRFTHKAGEKLFIDFCGPTLPIVNPGTGEVRNAQVFVAVLGASNYTFAIATENQKLESWLEAHVAMFAFFGGVPQLLVPDNLKSAVTRACRFEPQLNTAYQSLANHYGCAVMPARPLKPKDKAKAENAVLIVERWIMAKLRHQVFHTLSGLNVAIRAILHELNQKPFQRLPGNRQTLFESLDKPELAPLPTTPWEYTEIHIARVGIDYHVLYKDHFYSVPHLFVGKSVEIQASKRLIRIYYQRECIAQHMRSDRKGGFTCVDEHMPANHQHQKWSPGRLKNWAKQIGPSTLEVTDAILQSKPHPEQGYRACLGLLNLAKKYGESRLEQACRRAIDIGNPCRASVKSLLHTHLDNAPKVDDVETPNLTHHNIRGPKYYK